MSGTNQYMTKPFDLDELISRVRNLLTHYRPRVDADSERRASSSSARCRSISRRSRYSKRIAGPHDAAGNETAAVLRSDTKAA